MNRTTLRHISTYLFTLFIIILGYLFIDLKSTIMSLSIGAKIGAIVCGLIFIYFIIVVFDGFEKLLVWIFGKRIKKRNRIKHINAIRKRKNEEI